MRKIILTAALSLFASASAFAIGFCGQGQRGSSLDIESRIDDCRTVYGDDAVRTVCPVYPEEKSNPCFTWTLVSHQPTFQKGQSGWLWRDDSTGVVWGNARLTDGNEYTQAQRFCENYQVGSISSDYGKKWKSQLPLFSDFTEAKLHRIEQVPGLSGFGGRWWTSEVVSRIPFEAHIYSQQLVETVNDPFTMAYTACVIKPLVVVVK